MGKPTLKFPTMGPYDTCIPNDAAICIPERCPIFHCGEKFPTRILPSNHTEKMTIDPVKKILDKLNIWYVRMVGGLGMRKGLPDILCCKDGIAVGIECKGDKGKISEHQEHEVMRIIHSGGIALVIRDPGILNWFFRTFEDLKIAAGMAVVDYGAAIHIFDNVGHSVVISSGKKQ